MKIPQDVALLEAFRIFGHVTRVDANSLFHVAEAIMTYNNLQEVAEDRRLCQHQFQCGELIFVATPTTRDGFQELANFPLEIHRDGDFTVPKDVPH